MEENVVREGTLKREKAQKKEGRIEIDIQKKGRARKATVIGNPVVGSLASNHFKGLNRM
jgi:hypothetical protein